MKLIHIVPIADSYRVANQPMHMFLTHLVEKYPKYKEFAQQVEGYTILDNSLIELGDALDMTRVLQAADDIMADEIVLPDKFLDKNETLIRTLKGLKVAETYEKNTGTSFKKMAVVHGKNEEEWFQCFNVLNTMHDIDVLGIPKVTHKLHPKGRPHFVNEILGKTNKQIHLLGIWCDFTELNFIRYPDKIRSVDSSLVPLYIKNYRQLDYIRPDNEIINLEQDKLPDEFLYGESTDAYLRRISDYVSKL